MDSGWNVLISTVKGSRIFGPAHGRAEGDETQRRRTRRNHCHVRSELRAVRAKQHTARSARAWQRNFPELRRNRTAARAYAQSMLSGVNAQVAIKITVRTSILLRQTAKEVAAAVKPDSPAVTDYVRRTAGDDRPDRDQTDREQMARAGLTSKDMAGRLNLPAAANRFSSITSPVTYAVIVQLAEKDRRSLENLRNLLCEQQRRAVTLSDIADVRISKVAKYDQPRGCITATWSCSITSREGHWENSLRC